MNSIYLFNLMYNCKATFLVETNIFFGIKHTVKKLLYITYSVNMIVAESDSYQKSTFLYIFLLFWLKAVVGLLCANQRVHSFSVWLFMQEVAKHLLFWFWRDIQGHVLVFTTTKPWWGAGKEKYNNIIKQGNAQLSLPRKRSIVSRVYLNFILVKSKGNTLFKIVHSLKFFAHTFFHIHISITGELKVDHTMMVLAPHGKRQCWKCSSESKWGGGECWARAKSADYETKKACQKRFQKKKKRLKAVKDAEALKSLAHCGNGRLSYSHLQSFSTDIKEQINNNRVTFVDKSNNLLGV